MQTACGNGVHLRARAWCAALAVGMLLHFALAQETPVSAQAFLGTAENFAVLAGSAVTNTGPTVLFGGNLGVWPNNTITGFPPGIVVPPGTIHAGDAVAQQAQDDLTTAYNTLAGMACDVDLTGMDLGGLTLTPGVYCFSSTAQLTGTLTLDAEGDDQAEWVFQIGSMLTTATNSSVNVINAGQHCNVSWQIGSSATLGTSTDFVGNILALTSITMVTSTTLSGRALARNGAVTLDDNVITVPECMLPATNTPVPTSTFTPTNTPIPTSTFTPTNTPIPTSTFTPTNTPIPTSTLTPTNTPTVVPGEPTHTPAPNTEVPTNTLTPTNTPVPTNTLTPTNTPVPTNTLTPTNTPIPTNTLAPVPTFTRTPTLVPTVTPTRRVPAPLGVGGFEIGQLEIADEASKAEVQAGGRNRGGQVAGLTALMVLTLGLYAGWRRRVTS